MKTYKVELTEDFIKEAHEVACNECKTKIKDLVPEAFGNKEGWYKDIKIPKIMVKFNSFENYKENYGLNERGEWTNEYGFARFFDKKPATDKEVKKALVKEAKKRGLVKGIEVKCLYDNKLEFADCEIYQYDNGELWLDNGNILIFSDGKWAEPIEDNTEKRNYILLKFEEMENQLKELKKEL